MSAPSHQYLAMAKTRIMELKAENSRLLSFLEGLRTVDDEKFGMLAHQIRGLQQTVSELRSDKAAQESLHSETLQRERTALRKEVEAAEAHVERHRDRAAQARDERDKAEARAKGKESQVEQLEGQIKELRARCADILDKAEASEAVLRRQIEEQQLKLTQAIKENGRVMEMRDHLMSTADKATAENAQLRSELIQSQDALKKVTEDCNAANAKLQKIKMHSELRKAQKQMQEGGLGGALASFPPGAPDAPRPMSELVAQSSKPTDEGLPHGRAVTPANQGSLPGTGDLEPGSALLQGTKQGRAPRAALAPAPSGTIPLPLGQMASNIPTVMPTGMQQQQLEGSGGTITQQQQQRHPRRVPIMHPPGVSRQPRDPPHTSVPEGGALMHSQPTGAGPFTAGASSLDLGLPLPGRQPAPTRVLLTMAPPSQGGITIAPPSLPLPIGSVHVPRERQQLPLTGISWSGMPASHGGAAQHEMPPSASWPRSPMLYEPVDRPPYESRPRERDSRGSGAEMGSQRGSGGFPASRGYLAYGDTRRSPAEINEGRPTSGSSARGDEGRPASGGGGRGREWDAMPPTSLGPGEGRRDYYTEGSRAARDAVHSGCMEGSRHSPIPAGDGSSGRVEDSFKRPRYEDRYNNDSNWARDSSRQYERRR